MNAPRITVGTRVLVSNGLSHRSFRTSASPGEYLVISAPYDWPPDDEPEVKRRPGAPCAVCRKFAAVRGSDLCALCAREVAEIQFTREQGG